MYVVGSPVLSSITLLPSSYVLVNILPFSLSTSVYLLNNAAPSASVPSIVVVVLPSSLNTFVSVYDVPLENVFVL